MTNFHLLPDGAMWKITTENGKRLRNGIETKEQALCAAIQFATERGGKLAIYSRDGAIDDLRTYPRGMSSN
jgi:hypothetical protein